MRFELPPGAVKALGGPKCHFFPEDHRYFDGDQEIAGTSYILKSAGLVDDRFYSDHHRDRGHAVHDATFQLDAGTLHEFDPAIGLYITAYQKAQVKHKMIWHLAEMPIIHPAGFATTPDRAGFIDGTPGVLEIKTTESVNKKILRAWALQTASHLLAVFDVFKFKAVRRSVLQLSKTGEFFLQHFPIRENERDRMEFLSLARAHKIQGD